MKTITYIYRGQIERGADYHWCNGFSPDSEDGLPTYPWMTKRECQTDAKANGAKAAFREVQSFSQVGGNDWSPKQ
jgi:hypothetical protein